ncbi:putative bifunctional diguanylate cyclase/phosphodiesterase [Sphaerotilus montanus]|uniref:putative bifunctional diguanylate cyclase/phosphodiesterase n=1 Tax=Sphaerotilus montanus TaxID=522889 RepID=UPI003FA25A99
MSQPTPRILIVDDTPQNIDVLQATLIEIDADLLIATNGARALDLAQRLQPDLVLLDVMMPGLDGFEVCTRLKADPRTADIPVIFCTARVDDVAHGFAVGGTDYITKPIQPDEVRARVSHQLERRRLLRELRELNRALEDKVRERTADLTLVNQQLRHEINERRYMQDRLGYLASHDFVTRLHNRGALDAHVTQLLARLQRQATPAGPAVMLLVDIDQFRLVNESCGCIAGDELLRQFADLLGGLLRRGDFLARLGGDQFAVVSEAPDLGAGLARQLLAALQDWSFAWQDRRFTLTATIAIVPLDRDLVSFDQLMQMADETVFLAKRDGRGQIRPYTPTRVGEASQRETTNWALVLMDALRHGRFRIFFQRMQSLDAGGPLRVEVLVRLWDPVRGELIAPGQFIALAERFLLIGEIDRWMLGEVLALIGRHPELQHQLGQVTLNLSAVSLREPGLAQQVLASIAQHGVRPDLLCFEITETQAIGNLAQAREFMQTLHDAGCRFSLDDFGSGYASFAYLRELPFDTLKIDGLFVRDMQTEPTHQAMVRSMVDMARLLDKPVVAEFVETASVAQLLRELGVQWGQGYYFHQPEPLTFDALQQQARLAQLAQQATTAALH